jgi:NAD(P)-dependent dehydrogenase (short-subunit alcohol dehydrogenase family)
VAYAVLRIFENRGEVTWFPWCACPVEQADDDEMQHLFDTNVFGAVRMIRAVAPAMRERGQGTIVNISSIVAQLPRPFTGLYAASKAALNALSEALFVELAPFGVRVVLIEPGPYPTRLHTNEVTGRQCAQESPYESLRRRSDAAVAGMLSRTPDPREVADAAFEAVQSAQPRFHYVVGEVAVEVARMRAVDGFEGLAHLLQERMSQPA